MWQEELKLNQMSCLALVGVVDFISLVASR
jgi:hypothetical protein